MSSTLHIVMKEGGGTAGPTKRSNPNTIIYPSPLWFYRKPDVTDKGTYYEVNCFSENNYWWDLNGVSKKVNSVTFVDTTGKSHDVMFLGLDDYFCYKEDTDENGNKVYKRATGTSSQVAGSVKVSHNKASYWAEPITLILTIPDGYLDALCVRQACWDKVEGRGDPTGEKWEDWAERFSDIPLTYSDDTAKDDPHVFGPPGGNYSAGRGSIAGDGYYYMNGIVYNMQQYTKHNVFHIILPAQCIVEWAAKPKPPYFYTGGWYNFLPHTISELRQIIKDGEYDNTSRDIQNALISNSTSFDRDLAIGEKSSSMIKGNYELPEYIWGATIDNWIDLLEAGYGVNAFTRDFSNHYARIQIPASSASPLYYSSDINYCLLDVGSNVYNPIGDNGLSWAQGWITSISPLDSSVTFSDKKPTENENKPNIGVSFYPSEGGKIRVYDYYLPHKITNTQYRGNWPDLQGTLPCTLYDKGPVKYISSSDDYTYSVTLSEPNFRLGFVDDKAANKRSGVTWNKNSAPWAAAKNDRVGFEGYFVLKEDPGLSVSLPTITDYNYYRYDVTITNNDLFPAHYYIEDNLASKVSVSLGAGESLLTSIPIPREQTYSSPRNISHTIFVYSKEGGKEQATSAIVQVPNVPRNIIKYDSYYKKGTIIVTRTTHFGSPVNETLPSGSYIWQGDVLHVSITNIPSGYSFSRWSTGQTSTDFYYTVGVSSVNFEAQLTRSSYTFSYNLGAYRSVNFMIYRTLNLSGSYSSWSSLTGSKTLSTDDQVSYSIGYLPRYASNSSGSATTESETITMSSNVSKSFTAAAYMECYFGNGLGATDVIIKVDGIQVANNSWQWITNTSHNSLYYSCYFRSSNVDWDGNRAYAFNPLDMGNARSSSALGNDGWGDTNQHPSENGLYTVYDNRYSNTGYTTSIPAGSGGHYYYCTGARYYAYFRFKLTISLSLYHDWFKWGDKKALYNVYTYCQTYDWSKMSSKDWHNDKNYYNGTTMSKSTNLTLQGGNTFTINDSSNKKWNSSLDFYYYESNGDDGGVGDICLNGNPTLYYKDNSNLSEGIHTNVSSSGSYSGYGKCNGAQTLYAYQSTWTGPDTDCYKVAKDIYDNNGPANHGTFYICEMHPYKSNGCKTWYTEAM